MPQPSDHDARIANAEDVIHAYGGVLGSITPSVYAQSTSLLPCAKDHIKQAIQLLLWELGNADETPREGLIQGYVLLAHFISDEDADTLRRGQQVLASTNPDRRDLELADQAARIINCIKLEMETLMEEIQLFVDHSTQPGADPSPDEGPSA